MRGIGTPSYCSPLVFNLGYLRRRHRANYVFAAPSQSTELNAKGKQDNPMACFVSCLSVLVLLSQVLVLIKISCRRWPIGQPLVENNGRIY
jgi:hypothetical protein